MCPLLKIQKGALGLRLSFKSSDGVPAGLNTASGPTPAADLGETVARLQASNTELRAVVRQLQLDKRNLATENLSLLHRTRLAEDRLRARDRTVAEKNRGNPDDLLHLV